MCENCDEWTRASSQAFRTSCGNNDSAGIFRSCVLCLPGVMVGFGVGPFGGDGPGPGLGLGAFNQDDRRDVGRIIPTLLAVGGGGPPKTGSPPPGGKIPSPGLPSERPGSAGGIGVDPSPLRPAPSGVFWRLLVVVMMMGGTAAIRTINAPTTSRTFTRQPHLLPLPLVDAVRAVSWDPHRRWRLSSI